MIKKIIKSILIVLLLSLVMAIFINPHYTYYVFNAIADKPFIVASILSCFLSIYSLLGKKNIKNSIMFQSLSIGLLFHGVIFEIFQAIMAYFIAWWRGI